MSEHKVSKHSLDLFKEPVNKKEIDAILRAGRAKFKLGKEFAQNPALMQKARLYFSSRGQKLEDVVPLPPVKCPSEKKFTGE